MKIQHILILILLSCLFSCRWGGTDQEVALVEAQKQALGCAQFETHFWDALDSFLVNEKRVPEVSAMKDQVESFYGKGFISAEAKDAWLGILQTLFEDAPQKDRLDSASRFRMFFAAMEVGDESTEERKGFKTKIFSQMKILKESAPAKNCITAAENKILPKAFGTPSSERSLAEKGMRWLFATAYQSCQAVQKPAMNAESADIKGILDQGFHHDGIGHKRTISDRSAFFASHYYYQDSAQGPLCRNQKEVPLIYDYGGKPFSKDGSETSLDLFTDDGTGTEALGIDCAAAIFSATATAGLRLSPDVPLRARNVLGVNSRMFKNPEINGLECYQHIQLNATSSIQSGDIAAVNGHVLMVGEVGKDPLGVQMIKNKKECDQISAENFNFQIWQSSTQKGGIGLNHIEANAYLKDAPKMREGFETYAKEFCQLRFDKKEMKPQLEKFSLIRHLGTSQCLSQRISLKGEECVQDCLSIF